MTNFFKCAAGAAVLLSGIAASSQAAPDKSCVWEVKSDTTTVYLAGSIAFLREDDLPIPSAYDVAYDGSERLVFEVDPAESDDEANSRKAIMKGMYTDGGSLKDAISKELYKKVGDLMESSGADPKAVDQFRPWFAAIMISMTETMKLGARPDLGISQNMQDRAVKDKKPMSGLDSMEDELDMFEKLPKGAHEYMLKTVVDQKDNVEKEFDEYVKAWRTGDVAKLEEDDEGTDPKWEKILDNVVITKRNDRWIKDVEKSLAGDESAMYVIGVGHLIGEGSLVERLKKKGFKVKQLGAKAAPKKKDEKKKKKPKLIPVFLTN